MRFLARWALFGAIVFGAFWPARGAEATKEKTPLPASVDLRPKLLEYGLPPRHQGSRGTCSVFTTAAALEFALAKREGHGEPLSVEYLNWACNDVIGNHDRDQGQFFHNLLHGLQEHGVCYESQMNYHHKFDPAVSPSDEAKATAKELSGSQFKIHWIKAIGGKPGLFPFQIDEVKQTLASGYPVASGAGHSRLLVGYQDDATKPGGGIFITKDSGAGRFAEVTYEFVKTEVNDAYWVEPAEKSAVGGGQSAEKKSQEVEPAAKEAKPAAKAE